MIPAENWHPITSTYIPLPKASHMAKTKVDGAGKIFLSKEAVQIHMAKGVDV